VRNKIIIATISVRVAALHESIFSDML
jgi:hypothetical protein